MRRDDLERIAYSGILAALVATAIGIVFVSFLFWVVVQVAYGSSY